MKPSELKTILDQHRLWVESNQKQGTRANLQSADLRGATFTTNFKKVEWFEEATFSEDQIAWVCLHPKFHECAGTLKWVKVAADAA